MLSEFLCTLFKKRFLINQKIMFYFDESELKIRCLARILCIGPSGSGKSQIIQKILSNRKLMLDTQPTRIIYFYDVLHPQIKQFAEDNGSIIELIQGFNPEVYLDNNPANPIFIVLDDLMNYKNVYQHMSDVFTKYSRHLSISCCFMTQNLYHKGDPSATRFGRDLIINSSHKTLFNPIPDGICNQRK